MGKSNYITLIPASWLFNASVIGFLKILEKSGIYENIEEMLQEDGSIKLETEIFEKLSQRAKEIYFDKKLLNIGLVGKNELYLNYIPVHAKENPDFFREVIKLLENATENGSCSVCGTGKYIPESKLRDSTDEVKEFLSTKSSMSVILNSYLGASKGEFPNSYWDLKPDTKICHLCSYLLIHHHLAMSELEGESSKSKIFINSNSFKAMWEFSKLLEKYSILGSAENIKHLAIPLLRLGTKIMSSIYSEENNFEIVYYSLKKDKILPKNFVAKPNISKIITNERISNIIENIGNKKVLSSILDGNFNNLLDIAEKITLYLQKDDNNNKVLKEIIKEEVGSYGGAKKILRNLLELYYLIYQEIRREEYGI
jgi:CRISPR-associated protein Cst1